MLSEQSNILTSTEKLITSKADPPDRGPIAPRQGDPGSRVTFARNMGRHGCCHSEISSGLAKQKSRVLSPPPFNLYKFLINIRSSSLKKTMFT